MFNIERDFSYDGIAAIPDSSDQSYHYEKIADNVNGELMLEREDFYRALGIEYVERSYKY